jgi:hypothetical protein
MKKNETPAAGSEISMLKKWREWIKKHRGTVSVSTICTVLGFLILQLFVNPTFDLREKTNYPLTERLVISNPVAALPPVHLVYTVADNGQLQCEYMPSPSYTLYTTRKIDFVTPLIWAPRKTYYPIHEGSKLVDCVISGNIQHQEMEDASVVVWAAGRRSSGETGTIELTWEVANFPANVSLNSYPGNDYVRVDISNPNNYDVQYLAMVESPPIRVNNVYETEVEGSVASYNPSTPSPQTSSFPKSLEIRSTGDTGDTFKVNVPFVIDIPGNKEQIVDIQFEEQPPTIALVVQPSFPTSPPPVTQMWVLIIVAAVVIAGIISVIVVLPVVLIRRRHRP